MVSTVFFHHYCTPCINILISADQKILELDITIERKIKLGAVLLKTKKNELKIEMHL